MSNWLRILSQPKCQKNSIGTKVEFIMEASGINLTFQWYSQAGLAIPGACSPVLSLGPLRKEQFGFYRASVRDSFGSYLMSRWVELAEAPSVCPAPPMFMIEPKAVSARIGEFENLFSHAAGVNLHYQWYDENGMLIPGATDKYLLFTPLKDKDFGFYRCVVMDMFGQEAFSDWVQVGDKGDVMKDIC